MNKISNIRDLKDMLISALRYAIGRHTYIVDETIDFIKDNSFLIDGRVQSVMLNDLHDYIIADHPWESCSANCEPNPIINNNRKSIEDFYNWLNEFKVAEVVDEEIIVEN